MEEELWDMKAHKAYISQVDFVANAQQGIPQLCPCGSIMKRTVDEVDTYDYLPGKRFFICKDFKVSIDSLSMLIMLLRYLFAVWLVSLYLFGRMTVEEEVERLKQRVHDHDKLLRECEALKVCLCSQ